ncbi:hypothetical protein RchiOBHm_Chr1g0352091 [Rosa chinensis]|uniref:Uncharacterized protein n=1 Tax=Rosa chinensis TaxID=74649 RepID=A0A2P6SGH0_ROSCH|nr:hypothetical protein RchiOBHm_Chr1g0352091 [Rosa chinensis]
MFVGRSTDDVLAGRVEAAIESEFRNWSIDLVVCDGLILLETLWYGAPNYN